MRPPYIIRRRTALAPGPRIWRIQAYLVQGRTYHERRQGARVIPVWVDFGPWRR